MAEFEQGARVAVHVDGARRTGVVTDREYTVKYGQPLLVVTLDEPLSGGRETHLALAERVDHAG